MLDITRVFWMGAMCLLLARCTSSNDTQTPGDTDADAFETEEDAAWIDPYADQPWRPRYHFTPPENWMNDPNGLVFFEGEYHLFYQYAPEGFVLSPLHWGHAVSEDLVHWEHLPIAIYPDETLGNAYSGSAVVDESNTSGLCQNGGGCLAALFTHSGGEDGLQKQSLAISHDKGRSWEMFADNPVLEAEPDQTDFRDPKVFWDNDASRWVMALAAGDAIRLYESPNLRDWGYLSEFARDSSNDGGAWECPELFPLPVENRENERHWVMEIDWTTSTGGIGSGGRYFVGDFVDHRFVSQTPVDTLLRVDGGSDFYAAQSFSGMEENERIWLAWLNNWQYALSIPTEPWQGAMSLPRRVRLRDDGENGLRLLQTPVEALKELRGTPLWTQENLVVENMVEFPESAFCTSCEIVAVLRPDTNATCTLLAFVGENEETEIGYDTENARLFFDRRRSGTVDFSPHFPRRQETNHALDEGALRLTVFLDRSTVEVFAGDGETTMSFLVFPDSSSRGIAWKANGGTCTVESLTVYPMKSIWEYSAQ